MPKKTETDMVQGQETAEQTPENPMAHLEQMLKEQAERLKELEAGAGKSDAPAQTQSISAKVAQEDPWKQTMPVFIPRAMAGEQKFVMVGVNGRRYQVPRGKQVEVPLPLYERIMIMLEMENKAIAYQEKLRQDADDQNVLKRLS